MLTPRIINDCGGRQWQERTANLPQPGRFAFFVFEIHCDWYIGDYLVGLLWCEREGRYIVAGTVDDFDSACYAFCKRDTPEDVLKLYNYIHQKLVDFGYCPRGEKRATLNGFYLI